jgi:hypothetical protein
MRWTLRTRRDPLVDPRPGDVIRDKSTRIEIHVHYREGENVYYGRWRGMDDLGTHRTDIGNWREKCRSACPEVLQRREDCSREFLARLEGK